jgi:hypothetical protein
MVQWCLTLSPQRMKTTTRSKTLSHRTIRPGAQDFLKKEKTYNGRTTFYWSKYSQHYIIVQIRDSQCTEHACSGGKTYDGKTTEWDMSHNHTGQITVQNHNQTVNGRIIQRRIWFCCRWSVEPSKWSKVWCSYLTVDFTIYTYKTVLGFTSFPKLILFRVLDKKHKIVDYFFIFYRVRGVLPPDF